MAVTLTKYPVEILSGKTLNVFPGFSPVELEFKREDIAIIEATQSIDNTLVIDVAGDITGSLNVGEWVYLFSPATSLNYEGSFQVTDIIFNSPNTEITVNADFIEIGTGGYLNYKQNWFLESKLVDPGNNSILKYPKLLQNDGSPEGVVDVNTSMLVDFLKNEILESSEEVVGARNECKVMYREVWREDESQVFILVDQDPIIIVFAAENDGIEIFLNRLDVPKVWDGYPFWINFVHSVENEPGKRIQVNFDELDINKNDIVLGNALYAFSPFSFGFLQSNLNDKVNGINQDTRYIRFNAETSSSPDYQTGDYDDSDYLTINTPGFA